MGRAKSRKYEYINSRSCYRKRIRDLDGKYHALYAKTVKEMDEKVRAFKLEMQKALDVEEYARKRPSHQGNPFFDDYVREWLELHCGPLSYGTKADYQSVIKNHVIPPLSGMRIKNIRQSDIKRAMLSVCGKSTSIYDKTYMLMNQIFRSAVADGLISSNPCPPTRKGGIPPKQKHALTKEQVEILLRSTEGTMAHLFCMIGLYSGLRREEILGLQWDCVSLEDVPYIEVRRALRFEHNRPVISDQLKTKAAKRVIPIPPQLVESLKAAQRVSKSEYVVANRSDAPCSQTQFQNMWQTVVKRSCAINSPVTPHILRHTYITNLLLGGVDVKTTQYLAGHERATITLDIYAHLTYNRPKEILPKVNMAFGKV